MSAKDGIDALIRLLQILVSWPVIFLFDALLVRRELPTLILKLAERITKAPGGFEFASLKEKIEDLGAKVDKLAQLKFEPSIALTPGRQTDLQSCLDSFHAYLAKLGYQSQTGHVRVFVDPTLKDNAYYEGEGNRIVLGEPFVNDTDAVFREYTHHALLPAGLDREEMTNEQQAVESGLADYFACSFNNDPLFGEQSIHMFREFPEFKGKAAIRDLDNNRSFHEAAADPEFHNVGEIWSGAFWELRKHLGQDIADKLLFSAWAAALSSFDANNDFGAAFAETLVETCDGAHRRNVRAILKRRGLKL
jgi:hypothetical protein